MVSLIILMRLTSSVYSKKSLFCSLPTYFSLFKWVIITGLIGLKYVLVDPLQLFSRFFSSEVYYIKLRKWSCPSWGTGGVSPTGNAYPPSISCSKPRGTSAETQYPIILRGKIRTHPKQQASKQNPGHNPSFQSFIKISW